MQLHLVELPCGSFTGVPSASSFWLITSMLPCKVSWTSGVSFRNPHCQQQRREIFHSLQMVEDSTLQIVSCVLQLHWQFAFPTWLYQHKLFQAATLIRKSQGSWIQVFTVSSFTHSEKVSWVKGKRYNTYFLFVTQQVGKGKTNSFPIYYLYVCKMAQQ